MTRRLTRSRTDTVLGGVASGLAAYLNADPALVRIAWAVLVPLTGGAALLAYVVAWMVVPVEAADADAGTDARAVAGGTEGPAAPPGRRADWPDGRAAIVVGIGLVLVGSWFLLDEYLPALDWDWVWPAVLIGIGAVILLGAGRRGSDG